MRKIIIIIISILFFVNREKVIISGIRALDIWSKTLFPLLFPTFIINDLIFSSGIINIITKYLGKIYKILFRLPKEGIFVFFMSMISGTPSNAKNIKELYTSNIIKKDDITKILCTCYFYNPLFVITLTNIKTLLYLYIANIVASFITNIGNRLPDDKRCHIQKNFDLSTSIENNINILLNILGTITIFLILSYIIPIKNIYIKTLFSGILELTTGLNLLTSLTIDTFIYNLFLAIILSFGGLSILYQIKSILKDTSIDYKYFIKNRIVCGMVLFLLLAL